MIGLGDGVVLTRRYEWMFFALMCNVSEEQCWSGVVWAS